MRFLLCAVLCVVPALAGVKLEDPRFQITLFAEHPQIWTPTGIATDSDGRVLAIESNTHLPKSDYPGPKTDRIKIFTDKDSDGRADEVAVFAEGFRWVMNLQRAGDDLFVIQRDAVIVLRGGKPDAREQIITLETKGDFPHNGLGAFCVSDDGWLYVGLGENLGEPYTIKAKDGSSFTSGEGGKIFRVRRDGTKLERFATGFWNPFAMTFDDSGNLFAVDNDPDGRPPCRLLHVIRGGNYGYQFRYGRSGLHPFVAWDGELPGTLGMVAGTGEAPSGILWCAKIGWPVEYANSIVGTSWGDNLLETYPLRANGASFKSERKIFGRGDQSFRPVAMTIGPGGVVYITDWADREYAVHKKGRIWRLSYRGPRNKPSLPKNTNTWRLAEIEQIPARSKSATDAVIALMPHAAREDAFERSAAVTQLASLHREALMAKRTSSVPQERLAVLLALREKQDESASVLLKRALQDNDEDVRRIAIIWATEQQQAQLQPDMLTAALKQPTSLALVQTYLAAKHILSGYAKKSVWDQGSTGAELVEAVLKDESQPAQLRELARKLKSAPQSNPIVGAPVAEPVVRPQTEGEWLAAIGFGGEPEPGRKLFFSEKVGCARCHRVQGEGGAVGPDLSVIARSSDRAKLVNSILQPSANIGPLYVTREIKVRDGDVYTGLVPESKAADKLTIVLADGSRAEIATVDIESDKTSDLSLMPSGLENGLTVREFADLISFLQTLR
ncbi:MAG TPA: PVC-type heme-binding CxxCH protein [Verrucomicrobiae bacterium]|nr:PVC-type heme-binding CxxCH protein [Verrucomicrobiae bacterium]